MGEYISPHELEKKLTRHERDKGFLDLESVDSPMIKKSKGAKPKSDFDNKNRLSPIFDPRVGIPVTKVSRGKVINHRLTV